MNELARHPNQPPLRVVAFAAVEIAVTGGCLLVVEKQSGGAWIFPGGKPRPGESELDTLARELQEELGVGPASASRLGTFVDVAAHQAGQPLELTLWTGTLAGPPTPQAEIRRLRWQRLDDLDGLAPICTQLNPALAAHWGL